jgi:RimJ/RimL family protein N-acetyltransferase
MSILEKEAILETKRLTLRPPDRDDAARIAELAGDYDVARMTTRMPHPYTLADAEGFLAHCEIADPAKEHVFAITTQDDGLIGMIGLHSQGGLGPEIGYWLGKPWWGRGLATEAAQAVLAFGRNDWRRKLLVSGHFADNPASGGVLTKAGFLYTGVVEDRFCVSRGKPMPTRMMVWLA